MHSSRRVTGFGIVLTVMLVAGCSTTSSYRAPVSDSSLASTTTPAGQVNPATLPGAENAGKPGYYTVQPGDTLYKIATRNGQSWQNVMRWNNLSDPNVIEVGQVLRVVPPEGGASTTTGPAVATQTTAGVVSALPAPAPEPSAAGARSIQLIWPAQGQVITRFDGAANKGIDIAGKAGEPVLAAADGRVIYVGSGVRGYGNLVIIKHNDTFLTAYAHNQKLLVKEDQEVKKGQKIAEMGSTDADRVKLHFEVRRSGKPVDPLSYLPPR